jgi:hypothetical protein
LQVIVERKTPDLYHWALSEKTSEKQSEKAGEAWKPLLALDYARK